MKWSGCCWLLGGGVDVQVKSTEEENILELSSGYIDTRLVAPSEEFRDFVC